MKRGKSTNPRSSTNSKYGKFRETHTKIQSTTEGQRGWVWCFKYCDHNTQEDCHESEANLGYKVEFKAHLIYTVRPCHKKQKRQGEGKNILRREKSFITYKRVAITLSTIFFTLNFEGHKGIT